jgi:hypothetical protein
VKPTLVRRNAYGIRADPVIKALLQKIFGVGIFHARPILAALWRIPGPFENARSAHHESAQMLEVRYVSVNNTLVLGIDEPVRIR